MARFNLSLYVFLRNVLFQNREEELQILFIKKNRYKNGQAKENPEIEKLLLVSLISRSQRGSKWPWAVIFLVK